MTFSTTIEIQAPAARVWSVLTDVANWTQWNSTVTQVDGYVAVGQKVTVRTKASPGQAFPVRVSVLEAPTRMTWTGGMPLGLFRGVRTFTLREHDGVTTFDMREEFSGLMAPLLTRSIPNLQPVFDEFAACLKRVVEAPSHHA